MRKLFALCFLFWAATAIAATPEAINRLAGIKLFGKGDLWRETPDAVGKRMRLQFRPDGGGDSSVFMAPTGGKLLFDCPSSEVRVFSTGGTVSRIDLVLFNKGDNAIGVNPGNKKSRFKRNAFRKELDRCHDRLEKMLYSGLGRNRKAFFGTGKLCRQLPVWDVENAALVLDYSTSEFLMVHIVPPDTLDEHRRRVSTEQRVGDLEEYAANVVRKDNGDVYIDRVPMVEQGAKGYCVPATVERLARYFGVTGIDMHQLAENFRTTGGGGTSIDGAVRGTRRLLGEYGLRMKETTKLRAPTLVRNIDKGIPVLWFHYSTKAFQSLINESIAGREKGSFDEWLTGLRQRKKLKKGTTGAHVALIIGYNQQSGEFAVSNSWGSKFQLAWVRFSDLEQVDSHLHLYVVTPRR